VFAFWRLLPLLHDQNVAGRGDTKRRPRETAADSEKAGKQAAARDNVQADLLKHPPSHRDASPNKKVGNAKPRANGSQQWPRSDGEAAGGPECKGCLMGNV